MGTDDFDVLALRFFDGATDHTVAHGTGKQHYKIRRPDSRFEIAWYLCKDFCLIIVLLANTLIAPNHTIISPYDDDTHLHRSFKLRK